MNRRKYYIRKIISHREDIFVGVVIFSLILNPISFLILYLLQEAPSFSLFLSECVISLAIFSSLVGAIDERKKKEILREEII
ncbi:MAG: hypothetical protein ACFFAE_15730 [Candidatus Hodarchaeota archaeon]